VARGLALAAIIVSLAVACVTFLARKLIYRLRDVFLLMVAGGFIAPILNPLVVYLQSHRIRRRGVAVTVVSVWAILFFIGLIAAFGYPVVNGLTHLSCERSSYVSSAEYGKGWIGPLLRRLRLQAWVTQNAPKLPTLGSSLAKPALTLGKGAASLLAELGTVAALAALFPLKGPKVRTAALSLLPPGRSERYAGVAAEINRSVTGYAFSKLLTSLIAGLVVFVTLAVLGVDFLPMIGGALVGIPTVLFALGHYGTAGLVTLGVFVAYTQVENNVSNQRRNEPHDAGEPAARPGFHPGRNVDRRMARRDSERFRGRARLDPGCRRPAGNRPVRTPDEKQNPARPDASAAARPAEPDGGDSCLG